MVVYFQCYWTKGKKKKDEVRASDSPFKCHINDQTLLCMSQRRGLSPIAAGLRLRKTKPRVSSNDQRATIWGKVQPCRWITVKVRTLIGKKWNPESWDFQEVGILKVGDIWEDLADAGDFVPLCSDESSLPVPEVSSSPVGTASPSLAEGVSLGGLGKQEWPALRHLRETAPDSAQDHPPSLCCSSRPTARLKSAGSSRWGAKRDPWQSTQNWKELLECSFFYSFLLEYRGFTMC